MPRAFNHTGPMKKPAIQYDICLAIITFQGEGSNNIEESTIYSLFASGYETKVNIDVSIAVRFVCRNILCHCSDR